MFEQRNFSSRLVVERHLFVKDGEVARFLDISNSTKDKPTRIVVESTANIVVATFGEWLVLMITTAIGELRTGNVNDTLTGTFGYLMNESNQVLVAITESHTTTNSTLKERSRTRHVKRYHTLILVPDIHHAVYLFVARIDHINIKQAIPIFL